MQVKFIQMREYSIGKRLVEAYLNQPYSWFLSQNSADLGKTILCEVAQVTTGGIRPLIESINFIPTGVSIVSYNFSLIAASDCVCAICS